MEHIELVDVTQARLHEMTAQALFMAITSVPLRRRLESYHEQMVKRNGPDSPTANVLDGAVQVTIMFESLIPILSAALVQHSVLDRNELYRVMHVATADLPESSAHLAGVKQAFDETCKMLNIEPPSRIVTL